MLAAIRAIFERAVERKHVAIFKSMSIVRLLLSHFHFQRMFKKMDALKLRVQFHRVTCQCTLLGIRMALRSH